MKKSLIALSLAGAFVMSASAADVTMYGLVDYGFKYLNSDCGSDAYEDSTFQMNSSQNMGSRFGMKGTEELGNGVTVGFVLENGFSGDTGALAQDGRLFGREAQVYVKGAYGTLSFGRVGHLISANGSFSQMTPFNIFQGGWGSHMGGRLFHIGNWSRMDNTITYVSPAMAGFQLSAQYSLQPDVKEEHGGTKTAEEGKSTADRTAQLALTYRYGDFAAIIAGEWDQWSNLPRGTSTTTDWRERKDGYLLIGAATYDFKVVKAYASAEYATHYRIKEADNKTLTGLDGSFKDFANNTGYIDGHAFTLGVDVPAFGGTFKVDTNYRYAECVVNPANDYKQYTLAIAYTYDLSRRTTVYGGGSFTTADLGKVHYTNADDDSLKEFELIVGMIHRF